MLFLCQFMIFSSQFSVLFFENFMFNYLKLLGQEEICNKFMCNFLYILFFCAFGIFMYLNFFKAFKLLIEFERGQSFFFFKFYLLQGITQGIIIYNITRSWMRSRGVSQNLLCSYIHVNY